MESLFSYYELKLRVTEWFYYYYIKDKYTFLQSAERCFVDFEYAQNQSNLNFINFIFTIVRLLLNYEVKLDDEYIKKIRQAIEIYEKNKETFSLNADEAEELLEDYEEMKIVIYKHNSVTT